MVMPAQREQRDPREQRDRAPLPGWKAILIREETFKKLQGVQKATIDPHLDLRYLGDAAVLLALDASERESIVRRACDELRRFL
jgi:hypothetical protein